MLRIPGYIKTPSSSKTSSVSIKEIVQEKKRKERKKNLSSFALPHVLSNLYDLTSSVEHFFFSLYNDCQWGPVLFRTSLNFIMYQKSLQNIFFCDLQKTESHTGLEGHEADDDRINFFR